MSILNHLPERGDAASSNARSMLGQMTTPHFIRHSQRSTKLYERRWFLEFVQKANENPESEFLVFHFEQRGVSLTFTVIVLLVTVISVVSRENVQTHWLVGMIIAWTIWTCCLIAMGKLLWQKTTLSQDDEDDILGAAEVAAQMISPSQLGSNINHGDDPYKGTKRAAARLPILQRTATLQANAKQWEIVLLMCCAATLCFSVSLYLGKENCVKGVDVDPNVILDTCTGAVQFDGAFLVIYTGSAILLQVRVKYFAPVLIFMNAIFFGIRSIPQVPGVPTFVPEIVVSYAMVSFVQMWLCIGVLYFRESMSRDYFETSQRLQYHTLRLTRLRDETERHVNKFCPTDAGKSVGDGHGIFRRCDNAVVCTFAIDGLSQWSSLRSPFDAVEATNRFVEVLDALRNIFDYKPSKYDTIGDLYVVMDRSSNRNSVEELTQYLFGYALLAVSECNLSLVPLLERDAFVTNGYLTKKEFVESKLNGTIRLRAAVDCGRCACLYSAHTENVVVVGEAFERTVLALKESSLCGDLIPPQPNNQEEETSSTDSARSDTSDSARILAASIIVGVQVGQILSQIHRSGLRSSASSSTLNSNPLAAHSSRASGTDDSELPVLQSDCKRFRFIDVTASHKGWLNKNKKLRRNVKPMKHDALLPAGLNLPWVLVLLAHNAPLLQETQHAMEFSSSTARRTNTSLTRRSSGFTESTELEDSEVTQEAPRLGTTEESMAFAVLPLFTFPNKEIESRYQLWSRGQTQQNSLLVSFCGCVFSSVVLVAIGGLYGGDAQVVDGSASPMFWAILSTIIGLLGLGWSIARKFRQRSDKPTNDSPLSTLEAKQLERTFLTMVYFAHATCYCAAVYVSPRGVNAMGNGQLPWLYALFGISMSRPQWFGPLTMWTLDVMTSLAFVVLWTVYPYRTREFRSTHLILFLASPVYCLAIRYVMENAKRNAFVIEMRVWNLQEQLNREYDEMQAALERLAPNFIGKEVIKALREHHVFHPESHGVMFTLDPQEVQCAVIELKTTELDSQQRDASQVTYGFAINHILEFVHKNRERFHVSPVRVDGNRVILCSGVARGHPDDQLADQQSLSTTESERAHAFVSCCNDVLTKVIPALPVGHQVTGRVFLTCGAMIGGVIGTGRLSFNFYGPAIAVAVGAIRQLPWSNANHLIVARRMVMLQEVVEREAHDEVKQLKPRLRVNAAAASGTATSFADTVTSHASSTVSSAPGTGHGVVPHRITFSKATSIRVRGYAPIEIQFAVPSTPTPHW